ncbi:MAG: UDP-N-acetyl-alpha-D-muramoyl-L-alanyl-L-glutamate epimerase [Blastocatellia bacterium]
MNRMPEIHLTESQSKFHQLRSKHPRFIYERFDWELLDSGLKVSFQFAIEPYIHFAPEISIQAGEPSIIRSLNPAVLNNLAFHLGLIEMLSYWKATCSPEIVIEAGPLDAQQVDWWIDLLLQGMGEFFYVNQIDFKQADLVKILPRTADRSAAGYYDGLPKERPLVLASGGKDTALTLQLLRESLSNFNCLMLNPTEAAAVLVNEAGIATPIIVRRAIDPRLLALNQAGYLNGHTPFSAYLAFLGVTCAMLFSYSEVIVSNERSSNEGNVEYLGSMVNHQYSKSVGFEQRFRDYIRKYIAANVDYFSFLRPLHEIQIARLFADYPKYFPLFKSCNRNQGENSWCGACPKCVSVFTLLYPFVEHDRLAAIFGDNLFQRPGTLPLLRQMTGVDEHKPFECVGTYEETIAALYLGIEQANARHGALPAALHHVKEHILLDYPQAAQLAETLLSDWGADHHLPAKYAELLQARLSHTGSIGENGKIHHED